MRLQNLIPRSASHEVFARSKRVVQRARRLPRRRLVFDRRLVERPKDREQRLALVDCQRDNRTEAAGDKLVRHSALMHACRRARRDRIAALAARLNK